MKRAASPFVATLACAAILTTGCSHRDATPPAPATADDARAAFGRCLLDAPPPRHDGRGFEASLRRALQNDRMAFAVRAGRCERTLELVRDHDPATREFANAWSELLPLVQAREPQDIAVERAIRHAGNAWHAW